MYALHYIAPSKLCIWCVALVVSYLPFEYPWSFMVHYFPLLFVALVFIIALIALPMYILLYEYLHRQLAYWGAPTLLSDLGF